MGLLFRGRIVEDFKLSTGTFVHVGALRTSLLSIAPVLSDVVIAGEDRDEIGALAWLNETEVLRLFGSLPKMEEVVYSDELAKHLGSILSEFNSGSGSSARVERLLIMGRPPNLDLGEVTDKGSINQRQVLSSRAELVELLYAEPPNPKVILPSSGRAAK
jgi:feruloyl-CoA synthase